MSQLKTLNASNYIVRNIFHTGIFGITIVTVLHLRNKARPTDQMAIILSAVVPYQASFIPQEGWGGRLFNK